MAICPLSRCLSFWLAGHHNSLQIRCQSLTSTRWLPIRTLTPQHVQGRLPAGSQVRLDQMWALQLVLIQQPRDLRPAEVVKHLRAAMGSIRVGRQSDNTKFKNAVPSVHCLWFGGVQIPIVHNSQNPHGFRAILFANKELHTFRTGTNFKVWRLEGLEHRL